MHLKVGVDVGGTFTDIVVFNQKEKHIYYLKVLTTPKQPVQGILNGLNQAVEEVREVDTLIHASTLGTNMFFGQLGLEPPKTALITNEGFRDIIEIGRQNRPELYNLFFQKPKPLIPRNLRIGVEARIGANGEIIKDININEINKKIRELCSQGVEVYAVSFLHSYKNPIHEKIIYKIITKECTKAIVVTSHEIDPEPMEYERTSTTVVNAILKPILTTYLTQLKKTLLQTGFKGRILIMQSNGGVSSIEEALEKPAMFIESGPSAGAVAVAYFSKLMNLEKALGFDMGGTTAKAASIIGGEPEITTIYEVGGKIHMGRQVRGSGYPVRFPYIDLAEVSAGGGTIAWVDRGGALRVGPLSAGANPGPACYGLGGIEPTITDANLILGRLPEALAGGKLVLRRDLAEKALSKIARRLGLDIIEAAWSIVKLANTIMGRALRLVSIEKGHDPRDFSMFAFGGAGPLHAAELGLELGVREVIIPPLPGVFSALGLLVTDYKHTFTHPIVKPASKLEPEDLEVVFAKLIEKASKTLSREGIPSERRVYRRFIEAKYWGQGYTLMIPYMNDFDGLVNEFHEAHRLRYGFSSPGEEVVIVVARVEAVGLTEKPDIGVSRFRASREKEAKPIGFRNVYFESGWVEAGVYRMDGLEPGLVFEGPAVVELPDSTIVVPPGFHGIVDSHLSLVLRR